MAIAVLWGPSSRSAKMNGGGPADDSRGGAPRAAFGLMVVPAFAVAQSSPSDDERAGLVPRPPEAIAACKDKNDGDRRARRLEEDEPLSRHDGPRPTFARIRSPVCCGKPPQLAPSVIGSVHLACAAHAREPCGVGAPEPDGHRRGDIGYALRPIVDPPVLFGISYRPRPSPMLCA